jgi:hypothetical protein
MDLYCERLGPGLLAEPLNTFTNLAFFIAAWRAWLIGRHLNALSIGIRVLIALLIAIAVGSTLYHVFATGWARLLDVVPIVLFQLCYLWLYARWLMRLGIAATLGLFIIYYAATQLAQQFPHLLNDSLTYAPALIFLVSLGLYHFQRGKRGRSLLLAAAGVFTVSLFFRTIDRAICPSLPIGTHFLWHLLNGIVLYVSLLVLLLNTPGTAALPARGSRGVTPIQAG